MKWQAGGHRSLSVIVPNKQSTQGNPWVCLAFRGQYELECAYLCLRNYSKPVWRAHKASGISLLLPFYFNSRPIKCPIALTSLCHFLHNTTAGHISLAAIFSHSPRCLPQIILSYEPDFKNFVMVSVSFDPSLRRWFVEFSHATVPACLLSLILTGVFYMSTQWVFCHHAFISFHKMEIALDSPSWLTLKRYKCDLKKQHRCAKSQWRTFAHSEGHSFCTSGWMFSISSISCWGCRIISKLSGFSV